MASDNVALLKSSAAASSIDPDATGGKPKLIRQAAILADADSGGSHKSVTFQEPIGPRSSCPVHSAEYAAILGNRYRNLYNKLVESNQEDEESDMEASDADVDDDSDDNNGAAAAKSNASAAAAAAALLPLGGALRAISAAQAAAMAAAAAQNPPPAVSASSASGLPPSVGFMPRKLSTISSKGSFAATRDEEEAEEEERAPLRGDVVAGEASAADKSPESRGETRAVIEARPQEVEEDEEEEEAEKESLLAGSSSAAAAPGPSSSSVSSHQLPNTRTVTEGNRRYLNTDV